MPVKFSLLSSLHVLLISSYQPDPSGKDQTTTALKHVISEGLAKKWLLQKDRQKNVILEGHGKNKIYQLPFPALIISMHFLD